MSHPMSKHLRRLRCDDLLDRVDEEAVHAAADALDELHAIVSRLPKCVACNKPCVTCEDGGPEAELTDGHWVCSESCWDRVAEWGDDVKQSTAEDAKGGESDE